MLLNAPNVKGLHTWAPREDRPEPLAITGQGQSVMVSGGMGKNVKLPLVIIEPRQFSKKTGKPSYHQNGDPIYTNVKINSQKYIELVLEPLKQQLEFLGLLSNGRLDVWLMQDGAPSHTATQTLDWIESNFGLENMITNKPKSYEGKPLHSWPAHSPGEYLIVLHLASATHLIVIGWTHK